MLLHHAATAAPVSNWTIAAAVASSVAAGAAVLFGILGWWARYLRHRERARLVVIARTEHSVQFTNHGSAPLFDLFVTRATANLNGTLHETTGIHDVTNRSGQSNVAQWWSRAFGRRLGLALIGCPEVLPQETVEARHGFSVTMPGRRIVAIRGSHLVEIEYQFTDVNGRVWRRTSTNRRSLKRVWRPRWQLTEWPQ